MNQKHEFKKFYDSEITGHFSPEGDVDDIEGLCENTWKECENVTSEKLKNCHNCNNKKDELGRCNLEREEETNCILNDFSKWKFPKF